MGYATAPPILQILSQNVLYKRYTNQGWSEKRSRTNKCFEHRNSNLGLYNAYKVRSAVKGRHFRMEGGETLRDREEIIGTAPV